MSLKSIATEGFLTGLGSLRLVATEGYLDAGITSPDIGADRGFGKEFDIIAKDDKDIVEILAALFKGGFL